jgi:hypothetical protein
MRARHQRRRASIAVAILVFEVCMSAGCSRRSPTAPTPPSPSVREASPEPAATVEIAGHLWSHGRAGATPGAGQVGGFAFAPRFGRGLVPADVAADGSYRLRAPAEALVYLTSTAGHQPCMVPVRTGGGGEVTDVDLHVVTDRALLGANLPAGLPRRPHRVSGIVHEVREDGTRVPLADVWVGLDGAMGDGLVVAGTMTDADGRYVLCGIEPAAAVALVAGGQPYGPFAQNLAGDGDVVIDIPLRR